MKLERDNGLQVDPETEIIITVGATGAFATTCLSLFDAGDEVILFEPYYGYHLNTLLVAEVEAEVRVHVAAGLDDRPREARGRDHAEDARHRDLHAVEPVRQGVVARGDRRRRRRSPRSTTC